MNRDYKDLFAAFNAHRVRFLIVGAYALAVHAWRSRIDATHGEERVSVLSREHLIASKKALGRLQDLADVEAIENPDREGEDF